MGYSPLQVFSKGDASIILTACIAGMAVYAIPMTMIGPALPSIKSGFNLDLVTVGLLGAISLLGGLFSLLGGALADRYGSVTVYLLGFMLISSATCVLGLGTIWVAVPLGLFIMSLAGSCIEPAMNSMVSVAYSTQRATALNILHVFWSVGAFTGPLLGSILIASTGSWRFPYVVSALIGTTYFCLILAGRNRLVPMRKHGTPASIRRINWTVSGSTNLPLVFLIPFFYVGAELGSNIWLPGFLILYRHWQPVDAGLVLSLFWASMAVGRLGLARVSERIEYRRLILICGSISLASISLGISVGSPIAVVALWCVTGFCFGPVFPVIVAWASRCLPENTGLSSGVVGTVATIGAMFSSWLIGVIAQIFTLREGMMLLPTMTFVMLMAATFAANKTRK
jgi:fucose permease